MNDRASLIRNRIRDQQDDKSTNALRYPAGLRKEILAHVQQQRGQGVGISAVARSLGINANTICNWLRDRPARAELRPIVTEAPRMERKPTSRAAERCFVSDWMRQSQGQNEETLLVYSGSIQEE